jgi:hypothetical protein
MEIRAPHGGIFVLQRVNLSAETQYDNLKYVGLSIDSTDVDEDLDAYF